MESDSPSYTVSLGNRETGDCITLSHFDDYFFSFQFEQITEILP